MRKSVFLLSLFVLPLYMLLQAQEKTAPFWGKQEVYLMNQTEKTFHLVDALLKENPPSSGNPALARKAALQLLDGIFHDTRLDGSKNAFAVYGISFERTFGRHAETFGRGYESV